MKARPNKPFPAAFAEAASESAAALDGATGDAAADIAGDSAFNPKALAELVIAEEAAEAEGGSVSPSGLMLCPSAGEFRVGGGGRLLDAATGHATAADATKAGAAWHALSAEVAVLLCRDCCARSRRSPTEMSSQLGLFPKDTSPCCLSGIVPPKPLEWLWGRRWWRLGEEEGGTLERGEDNGGRRDEFVAGVLPDLRNALAHG